MEIFKNLEDDNSPAATRDKLRLSICVLSTMCSMRMSLLHPILPNQGRELTALFSPSRRDIVPRKLSNEYKAKKICVGCADARRQELADEQAEGKHKARKGKTPSREANQPDGEEFEDPDEWDGSELGKDGDLDAADEDDYLHVDKEGYKAGVVEGDVFQLGPEVCASAHSCPHFACGDCAALIRKDVGSRGVFSCPRCRDLHERSEATFSKALRSASQTIMCEHVAPFGAAGKKGFVISAKLQQCLEWISALPANEKVIHSAV